MQRITRRIYLLGCLVAALLAMVSPALPQGGNPELQEKVAALKQAVANNQRALRQYAWTEKTDMIFKGETKSSKFSQCQYAPDGTVQKTEVGSTPPPKEARGLKGRVVEKKKDEMKDYMERVASLIKRYVPPDGSQMQESFQSGNASIHPTEAGIVTLVFGSYAKPGDAVNLTFDAASKKIRSYDVTTYLDSPGEVVTLKVVFENLPDGTNYVAQSLLDATAKQIQIRTTNSGYNRL